MNNNHRYPVGIDYLTLTARYEPSTWVFMIDSADLGELRQFARRSAQDAGAKGGKVRMPITTDGRLVATAQTPLIVLDARGRPATSLGSGAVNVSISGMFRATLDRRTGETTVVFDMASIRPGKPAKSRPKLAMPTINQGQLPIGSPPPAKVPVEKSLFDPNPPPLILAVE